MMKIGFAEKSITPEKPVWLQGQFRQRKSEFVETPVMACVMSVETDDEQLILCSCDLCVIHAPLVSLVRDAVSRITDEIDVSKIIMFATHTHTSLLYSNESLGLNVVEKYLPEGTYLKKEDMDDPEVLSPGECEEFLAQRISEAIVSSWNNRREALQGREYGSAVVGYCRRVVYADGSAAMYGDVANMNFMNLEGGSSSDVELLYIFDTDKNPMGVLVNVPCPSQVVEMKSFISSDYWGKTRNMLKERFGEEFCVLGMCSAAGCQAPRDILRRKQGNCSFMSEIEGTVEIGKRLSEVVISRFDEAQKNAWSAKVIHESTVIDFPVRRVTPAEYREAARVFKEYVNEQNKAEYTFRDMRDLYYLGGAMKRYEEQRENLIFSAEVHFVRFGDIAIATSPFELFLDYGLRIKTQSPAEQTFLIQLACNCGGYLPTEKAEKGGGYSAFVASGKTGHEGGDLLVRKTLSVLDSMWEKK